MKKEQLIQAIIDTASNDESFLMNDCNGQDLMMDAVSKAVHKMSKKELLDLHDEAMKSQWYEGDFERILK